MVEITIRDDSELDDARIELRRLNAKLANAEKAGAHFWNSGGAHLMDLWCERIDEIEAAIKAYFKEAQSSNQKQHEE